MNIGFLSKTITTLITSIFLTYVLITTKDLLTRVVVIPFLLFDISLFIRNVCLILKKYKIAKLFSKISVIVFFIYYFGFLVFFDYLAIINKEWTLVVFSFVAWFGGISVIKKIKKGYKESN